MDANLKTIVWQQFGAAIDMLENALLQCPEPLWSDASRRPPFWYLVYHTLFWLDLYLSDSMEGFAPPAPFTLSELEPEMMPERVYTKDELRAYLEHGRRKCRATLAALTEAKARERRQFVSVGGTTAEMLLYNLRHVQHHAAQLNLILRAVVDSAPGWVGKTRGPLEPTPRISGEKGTP